MMGNTLEITEARKQLNCLDERIRDERVIVVTKHSRKAFAIVDIHFLSSMLQAIEMMADPEAMRSLQQKLRADA
jgi:PHD/YefM family antitoxin component YafN of YafNO toxin-antitoxin module